MDVEDSLPVELPTNNTSLTRAFYVFVLVPTVLGAAHHIDDSIRGNHVGWPLTPNVNPFTYSLVIYLLLAISLYLTLIRRVEARYWAGFFAFSAGMLAAFHISPWAVEPPQDVTSRITKASALQLRSPSTNASELRSVMLRDSLMSTAGRCVTFSVSTASNSASDSLTRTT